MAFKRSRGASRPRTSKRRRAPGRTKVVRRRRAYGRYATRPSRFRVRSKSSYRRTQAAASLVSLVGENKYAGYNSDQITGSLGTQSASPINKPGGTQPLSYVFFNTGGPMQATQNPTQWNNMNLFTFAQGDGKTQRDGDYLYIKHASIKLNVSALGGVNTGTAGAAVNQGLNAPILYRLMVVKANRKNQPLGISYAVNNSLFLNTENTEFGPAGTSASPYLYMNAPINTRKWLTYMDRKFVLSPAGVDFNDQSTASSINTADGKYPNYKNIHFKCPVNKKVHFDVTDRPDSVDTQWLVILQAVNTGYLLANSTDWAQIGAPRNYRVQALGTTSALDA